MAQRDENWYAEHIIFNMERLQRSTDYSAAITGWVSFDVEYLFPIPETVYDPAPEDTEFLKRVYDSILSGRTDQIRKAWGYVTREREAHPGWDETREGNRISYQMFQKQPGLAFLTNIAVVNGESSKEIRSALVRAANAMAAEEGGVDE